jgi:hypothetical protein
VLGFYLKVMGLNLAVTKLALLMMAFLAGSVHLADFLFLNAIQLFTVSLIFLFLDLFGSGMGGTLIKRNHFGATARWTLINNALHRTGMPSQKSERK